MQSLCVVVIQFHHFGSFNLSILRFDRQDQYQPVPPWLVPFLFSNLTAFLCCQNVFQMEQLIQNWDKDKWHLLSRTGWHKVKWCHAYRVHLHKCTHIPTLLYDYYRYSMYAKVLAPLWCWAQYIELNVVTCTACC